MRVLMSFALASLLAGPAFADDTNKVVCPAASSITQKEVSEKESGEMLPGYQYSASNASGEWVGFTPYADEADLSTFVERGSDTGRATPICRYEGKDAGISLVRKP